MIALILAALVQTQAPDPCNATGQTDTSLPGCPQWQLVGQTDEGRSYVDPASVRRDGDGLYIDFRFVFARPLASGVSSFISRESYDCALREVAPLRLSGYDARGVLLFDEVQSRVWGADEGDEGPGSDAAILAEYCPRQDRPGG